MRRLSVRVTTAIHERPRRLQEDCGATAPHLRLVMPPTNSDTEFEAFYRARSDEARRYAATILARRAGEELEDALQTSWARAWKAWDQADPQRRDAWFFRIVRNCCLDVHRRHRPTEQLDDVRLPGVDHIDPVIDAIDAKRSLSVLQHLKPALRETLWLREVMQLSYAEIADLQDVPIGTVMSRLHAGRKKLARLLKGRL